MKRAAIILAFIVAGCATGGTVMLAGKAPEKSKATDEVELFLDSPKKPYKVIALVNSSRSGSDLGLSEGMALEKLKEQAAQAGADGIVEIQREVMDGGAVVSSGAYGRATATENTARASAGGIGSLIRTYTVVFRGKAIRFE